MLSREESVFLMSGDEVRRLTQKPSSRGSDASERLTTPPPQLPPPEKERPRRMIHSLSESELNMLQRVFMRFSKGSNSTSGSNLHPLLCATGHEVRARQARELFEIIDVNKNGTLEFDEFIQMVVIYKATAQYKVLEKKEKDPFALSRNPFGPYLPDHPWRWLWDTLLVAVTALIAVSVAALHLAVESSDYYTNFWVNSWIGRADVAFSIPLGLEMFFQFRLVRRAGDSSIVTAAPALARAYARQWLWADLLALLPLRLFISGSWPLSLVMGHLRLIRLVRIRHLFGVSGRVNMDAKYVRFHFFALPLVRLLLLLMVLVAVMSVVWYRLHSGALQLGTCIYISLYFISGVGLGDIAVIEEPQRIFACLCCVVALLVNGFVVGSIVGIMGQADVEGLRRARLVQTKAVLDFFEVPDALQEEIIQFQNHVYTRDVGKSYRGLTETLPGELSTHLPLQLRIGMLRRVPVIKASHNIVKIVLAQSLQTLVFCPEEYLVVAGDTVNRMFFLNYGFADAMTQRGLYVRTLKCGDVVAEELLYAGRSDGVRCELSVKCLSYVEVFALPQEALTFAFDTFPVFEKSVEAAAPSFKKRASVMPLSSLCAANPLLVPHITAAAGRAEASQRSIKAPLVSDDVFCSRPGSPTTYHSARSHESTEEAKAPFYLDDTHLHELVSLADRYERLAEHLEEKSRRKARARHEKSAHPKESRYPPAREGSPTVLGGESESADLAQ